jgi:two-component system, NtrC family, response regulator AtoC
MTGKQILIVDDEVRMRRVLEIALRNEGHVVLSAENGRKALSIFDANTIDLVIADLRMPEMGGLDLLIALRAQQSNVPVIVVTAHGTIETAVAAMKHGAFDYVLRPFDMDVMLLAVSRALNSAMIARQNAFLRAEIDRGWDAFIGTSRQMQDLYELIRRAGPSKAPVLITGETGTGKELAARALHTASPRREQLFVPINCAAIPADIIEGELFGHEKGAFTGAVRERVGKFELADGGTLFLDEITEMPLALQPKLLRVLQENTIQRLGSNRTIALDLRIVAATNLDPTEAIRRGKLREDLYYRLNVIALHLPALRDRREDIPVLIQHFAEKFGARGDAPSESTLEKLKSYAWPGNVRELENMVERATILSPGGVVDFEHLIPAGAEPSRASAATAGIEPSNLSLEDQVGRLESRLIADALARADGNKARAAALLDISERALWYKLKKYREL